MGSFEFIYQTFYVLAGSMLGERILTSQKLK